MSRSHFGVGRLTLLVIPIVVAGGLTVRTADQNAQPAAPAVTTTQSTPAATELKASPPGPRTAGDAVIPPAVPAIVVASEPDGPHRIDPSRVMPKPDGRLAPDLEVGIMAPAAATSPVPGNVGPDGKPIGQDAPLSPDGSATVVDKTTERLGPGGLASAQTLRSPEPGTSPNSSGPAGAQQQQVGKANVTDHSSPAPTEPAAATGLTAFIDPATGQLVEPTDAQLAELERLRTANRPAPRPAEVVERPGDNGGMVADVPTSFFPLVTATIDADGQVTLQESRTGDQAPVATPLGPSAEQPLRSVEAQRLGPAGDPNVELPPPPNVTITILNMDGAGEGFNDPTVVAPVFGNSATTLGAQRLNAFRAAAEYWGGILKSVVPIQVSAQMDPQFCTATSAVLGSAGPTTVHRDFAGAPVAATWYVQATANSRAGVDLAAGTADINATFNSDVDNPVCLGATSWWYGIGAPAPAGTIDFYTVVQHEIGHGIGYLSLVSLSTGGKFLGFDDAYERWLWDWTVNLGWPAMTDAQRLTSSVNTGNVIFWGPESTEAGRGFLTSGLNLGYPRVYAPNPVQSGSSISHFDTVLTPNELMEPFITPPPGPYVYLTSGLLEDVGWLLLTNGVFDFNGSGTWTWNSTSGWAQPTTADPSNLEAWNGNFVGIYSSGTWLWNGTTGAWSQLTSAIPQTVKACGNNLFWAGAAYGTWRYNLTTGWQQLTGANPQSVQCFGGDMAWEWAGGTWIYNFTTASWTLITGADPTGILPCGARLVWWSGPAGTWYYSGGSWTQITGVSPQSTECYRGKIAWESPVGTWLYDFSTGWTQITSADPDQIRAWGPNLVWESALGTWIYDQLGGWTQITAANPTLIEALGDNLLWAYGAGTWVWSGGGGGAAWTNITAAVPSKIVGTGAVQ